MENADKAWLLSQSTYYVLLRVRIIAFFVFVAVRVIVVGFFFFQLYWSVYDIAIMLLARSRARRCAPIGWSQTTGSPIGSRSLFRPSSRLAVRARASTVRACNMYVCEPVYVIVQTRTFIYMYLVFLYRIVSRFIFYFFYILLSSSHLIFSIPCFFNVCCLLACLFFVNYPSSINCFFSLSFNIFNNKIINNIH